MTTISYPVPVYLFGGEGTGWALDADVETTRQSLLALPELVRLSSLDEAEVVHSVWEYPLLHMSPDLLDGKRIICHICNDLMRTYEDPCMVSAGETLGLWIAISRIAEKEISRLGFKADYVPYSVDTSVFTESIPNETITALQKQYSIPEDVFLISSFMRDSSGSDLQKPKEQKGVELFVAVVRELKRRRCPIHLLLAGPRRHWLIHQLRQYSLPFTYVGEEVETDDNAINILSPEKVNQLYHLSDLHLVTSRWEGGPRAALEAAATRTPIFCTPVGMAPDILEKDCLIDAVDDAVNKIEHLIAHGSSKTALSAHYNRIRKNHTPAANIERFRKIYEGIHEIPCFEKSSIVWRRKQQAHVPIETKEPLTRRIINLVSSSVRRKKRGRMTIGLWHEYHKPPYGGGNQFMMALKACLEQRGVNVAVNKIDSTVDVHICNSAWFDVKRFEAQSEANTIRMIHRIDGPITLYRGEGTNEDDRIFELNRKFASATVFQSAFSFFKSCDLGYRAVSPTVIHNSVDDRIFNARGRRQNKGKGKLKLISTAWSDNPRKGGPFYKWLDQNLDFNQFDYTFVGRVQQRFQNISHIEPQSSESLAALLRDHDIYITASHHEPCSNALLEALACGLPALYRNDGGNKELVGFGGLPFNDESDCLKQLARIADGYESFQSTIYIKSIEEIAGRYLELAEKIVRDYAV